MILFSLYTVHVIFWSLGAIVERGQPRAPKGRAAQDHGGHRSSHGSTARERYVCRCLDGGWLSLFHRFIIGHGGCHYSYDFSSHVYSYVYAYSYVHLFLLIVLILIIFPTLLILLFSKLFFFFLFFFCFSSSASSFASSALFSMSKKDIFAYEIEIIRNALSSLELTCATFSSDQISNQQMLCSGTKAQFRRLHQMSLHRLLQGLVRPGKWHTGDASSECSTEKLFKQSMPPQIWSDDFGSK